MGHRDTETQRFFVLKKRNYLSLRLCASVAFPTFFPVCTSLSALCETRWQR